MTTYTTYSQVGRAEDVSDIIKSITPFDVPFFSMIGSERTHARNFDYQSDVLRSPSSNAKLEGADASMITISPTTLRSGTCQIISEAFQISETADAIKTYGRAKETAYQLAKTLKNVKRDYEHAMVGVSNAAVAGNASTAREMASIDQMITTSLDAGSNATDALTETKILTLGQTCYTNGSSPDVMMCKPADAQLIANMAASLGRERDFGQSTKLVNAVDIYVSPFGTYKVVLNRHQLSTHLFLLDPGMFKSVVLRPFSRTLLAKTGDSDKHQVLGEVSVKHQVWEDSGMITGLS
mgnify:CR=1 FL=1